MSVYLDSFPDGSGGKTSACHVGDMSLIPGSGRYPGEGNGYPLQYSGLENPMDCIVNGVTKSQTQLGDFHWTVAHQAPRSMGFSRQEYWSGLPCPPSGNLPDPGIKLMSLMSPALADWFFTTSTTWEAPTLITCSYNLPSWVLPWQCSG